MIHGSCLCGGVAWELPGPLEWMGHCHCSMCRKAHGAAFATYAGGPSIGFRWIRGQGQIRDYESSPGFLRPFCSTCGSVVPSSSESDQISIPAGCLDDDPGISAQAHIFAASKAPWYEIPDDGLPRFDAYPPGTAQAAVPRAPETAAPRPDAVRGSCLCGDVAYEIAGPYTGFNLCHCSRCRKARSSAFAANLFGKIESFSWVRGEDAIDVYKLPGAQVFQTQFCRRCGSDMPGTLPRFGAVGIPAGTLDQDPGFRPKTHGHVQSRVPWFEIRDALPQYAETPPLRELFTR